MRYSVSFLCIFLSCSIPLYPQDAVFSIDEHTIALWCFNETNGNTAFDSSAYRNDAGIANASWITSPHGHAVSFNGTNSLLTAPYSPSLAYPDSQVTIDALIYIDTIAGEWAHIIDHRSVYALSLHNGKPAFYLSGIHEWWTPETPIVSPHAWHTITAQFDGKKKQLFVDGLLIAEQSDSGQILHLLQTDIQIGAGSAYGYPAYWFSGKMDEIRISDTSRYHGTDSIDYPPYIITSPSDTTVQVDNLCSLRIKAYDVHGLKIHYLLIDNPDLMTLDPDSGWISWVPFDTGVYPVRSLIVDENGMHDTTRFIINVIGTPSNHPPLITTIVQADTAILFNSFFTIHIQATDPDSDTVRFFLLSGPSSMAIDSISGFLQWMASDTGGNNISIRVTDQKNRYDTLSFLLHSYKNYAPSFTIVFSDLDTNIFTDSVFILNISIIDPNGDRVILEAIDKPGSMNLSLDSGVLRWTPQISDTGRHLVAIKASDTLGASDTFAFHINVTRFNNTPCIISTPNYTTSALTYWTYFIRAFDPDGDILTCSLAVFPSGMMLSADTVRWYPAKTQAGDFPVTIIVRDNRGKDTSQNFYLHVAESPYPLEFRQWSPVNFDTSIYETDVLNLRVVAWNADSLALFTYWWEVADSEVSNTNMWTFFQTDYESAGLQCTVFAYATDGTDTISAVWHILVKNRAIPPEIVSPSDNDSLWGDSLLSWRIVDPDFDKNTGVYRIELYEDSLFSNKLKTIDSIYDTSATLINLLQQWDIPESSMVYWRVSGKDGSGYSIGYSSTKSRFFFCGLEDIAIERVSSIIPKKYELYQNSPNPFNPMTTIRFAVPKRGSVSIVIHDIQGKLVKKYFFPSLIPGYYSVACNMNNMEGKQYPNGLYAYTLKTNEWTYSRKMLLLK